MPTSKTFQRLFQAALAGDPEAQCDLAYAYATGTGVARNPAQAFRWFQRAADHGQPTAMYNLGVCFENGDGVKADLRRAARWYAQAAALGDPDARMIVLDGAGVRENARGYDRRMRVPNTA